MLTESVATSWVTARPRARSSAWEPPHPCRPAARLCSATMGLRTHDRHCARALLRLCCSRAALLRLCPCRNPRVNTQRHCSMRGEGPPGLNSPAGGVGEEVSLLDPAWDSVPPTVFRRNRALEVWFWVEHGERGGKDRLGS